MGGSEELCVGEGTLSTVSHGEKILWPKHSVSPWPVTLDTDF